MLHARIHNKNKGSCVEWPSIHIFQMAKGKKAPTQKSENRISLCSTSGHGYFIEKQTYSGKIPIHIFTVLNNSMQDYLRVPEPVY